MFDARSILDILLGGPAGRPRQGRQVDSTVFKDMLDQLGDQGSPTGRQAAPGGAGTAQPTPRQGPAGQPAQSLEDLLRGILTGTQSRTQSQGGPQQQGPAGGGLAPGGQHGPAITPEVTRELQDLLRQILQGGGGGGGTPGASGGGVTRIPIDRLMDAGDAGSGQGEDGSQSGAQNLGANLGEALRQVLGQATQGVRDGAARIDEATGLSERAREAVGQATGQTPEDLVATLKKLIAENQLAAGTALGGLGALVLGTSGGRSLAATAVRLGSLALIGGLAYKAVQNYQQGRPLISSSRPGEKQSLLPAPEGSGFEPAAVTDDTARRYIRAMIAAAAADGRIDATEQQKILVGLQPAGLESTAQQFLTAEIVNPATVDELAAGVSSPEEAVQVYTAARIAVDPDTDEEHEFLSSLAEALGIDEDLARQVDSAARAAA
jgi:uncharacterized membrane protein YebE (DUF533 family)